MHAICKTLKFEAAHVLDSSYSKCCQQIHGHSYLVDLYFRSEELNTDGMVVDFGKVKKKVDPLIWKWDHALIISAATHKKYFTRYNPPARIVIVPYNPTAENMARDLFEKINRRMLSLYKVRVHETATGWAEYERSCGCA